MRTFVLAALVALAAAHPPFEHPGWTAPPYPNNTATPSHHSGVPCISAADASLIGTSFGLTISNYTEALAIQLFTNDFTDQSDSVNTLIHEPGLAAQDVSQVQINPNTQGADSLHKAGLLDLHLESRVPRRPGSSTTRSIQDPQSLEHLQHCYHPLVVRSRTAACSRHQYRFCRPSHSGTGWWFRRRSSEMADFCHRC